MNYLFIHEDSSLIQVSEITVEDKLAVADGILDIIRYNPESENFEQYCPDGWVQIEVKL